MIDYSKLTRNLAKDLCRRQELDNKEIESLVREAFRRGLQLGLSVRVPRSLTRAPAPRTAPPLSPLVQ